MRRDLEREREFKRREAAENEEALRRGERELLEKNRRLADEKWRAEKEAEEQARERSRREQEKKKAAEEKRRAEREAEERARERSRREHEKKMAAEEARTREVERQSKAEYERQLQERLDQDMQIMIQKSLDEAARKKKEEEEEMQRALRESARLEHMERKYQEDAIRSTRTDVSIRTAAPPSPPATPPMKSMPPPPPPAPAPVPKLAVAKSAPRPPPAPKPATVSRETNYALPPVGEQKIGRFKLGGRSVPIHESQDIPDTPTTSGIPMSPSSPAPFARLGGAIAPSDMPIMRELKGQVPPVVPAAMDSKAGLRKTGGPRKVPPPVPERMGVDPKLAALLAKQRAWEPEDDDEMGAKTVTPPESPSGIQARRLSPVEFDIKRKSGWKKEEE
ncbi:hypothetical protein CC77DRAFT_1064896 [Alternaria alternata]|uniref:Uncharacterized protein n=2 Tax=Alternaria alternata complex TaxID=187734 RepID=A0A177DBC9_ALTAL|nr:hypothetical protein CC77DRAFT_1064896 [Alternaria alternata]RYN99462.1 hypothetical protein AA0120_g1810 [Alternaria tenuissima]KAH6840274.1 hypothetical protein B0T12DRAFT_489607 [Alternaria alternata]OAG16432.1 hypothetical protein CC77DRAFT_1064896 [Alternaria alternata]RYN77533.1 hypothetical protein AA0117_g5046 [Alternaria alternata]RYO09495.1 hypothetical protein AA0119_g932 [Alternaria tenuissima]